MALTKSERKEQRRIESLARRARREAAKEEVVATRLRVGGAMGLTYVATQVLPAFIEPMAKYQSAIDLLLGVGGIGIAVTDDSETGDYALGVGLVGALQTFDTIGQKLLQWFGKGAPVPGA